MYFRNYGLRKPWLDTCLKSPVSEDPSKCNMVNGPKHSNHNSFIYLLINVKAIDLEKVSLSNMQNLRPVCEEIHCRSQVLFS